MRPNMLRAKATMPTFRMLPPLLSTLFLLTLVGCDQQQNAPSSEKRSGLTAAQQPSWLDVRDTTEPAAWLFAYEVTKQPSVDEKRLHKTLSVAALRFGESSRMIANRAVQLEHMLEPLGGGESAISLISDLSEAIGDSRQAPGFGTVGQYYYNLRKAGFDGPQAINDLSRRYGSHD